MQINDYKKNSFIIVSKWFLFYFADLTLAFSPPSVSPPVNGGRKKMERDFIGWSELLI